MCYTSSKVDELRLIVENYLTSVDSERRNTQDLVKELKVLMANNIRKVDHLQFALSANQKKLSEALRDTTLQLEKTRSQMGVMAHEMEMLEESLWGAALTQRLK